ncbi:MAG: FHA domain-containing protein, partial [Chloroflexota bacterium]
DVVEDTRPTTLIGLVIVATGYIVTIDVDEEITVGRMSNTERALHLDLTPYGANSSGVSRIRARISRTEKGITLEDLGSTNGTFLNEYRLQSFAKVPIQDGDTLELGKLRCRVKFLEKTL